MKILLISIALCITGFAYTAIYKEDGIETIRKDVSIIIRVMDAALSDESNDRGRHFGGASVEGYYLKGQGVLLEIESNSMQMGNRNFHFVIAGTPMSPMTPIPPIPPVAPGGAYPFGEDNEEQYEALNDMAENLDDVMSDAQESIAQALESISELGDITNKKTMAELRKLRDSISKGKLQEIRAKIRESHKKIRASKSDADRKALQVELEALEKSMQTELSAAQTEADRIIKIQEARQAERIKAFEGKVLDALCNYGSGMRSLPENENMTVILKRVESDEDGKGEDRIYVFKKSDLLDCRDGKISRDQLLGRAGAYRF